MLVAIRAGAYNMIMANKMSWFLVFSGVMTAAVPVVGADEFSADLPSAWLHTQKMAAQMPTPASRPVNDQGALNMEVQTKDLVAFVNALSKEDQDEVISKTASMMGAYFRDGDYRRTEEVRKLLSTLNSDSGYALYFEGELHRKQGRRPKSHAPFERYLDHEKTVPVGVSKTGPEIKECSKDALGYCQQRTAWICHLLANDYFAMAAKGMPEQKMALLYRAAEHAQCALDNYPTRGFDAMGSLLQTVELQEQIKKSLAPFGGH